MAAPDKIVRTPRPGDRGAARQRAFLEAARQVFLRDGYEAASVNDVVKIAGGSLATLYSQFGNKEGLFLAMARARHDNFIRSLTPERVDHMPLEQGLQVIGEQFLRALLAPDTVAMFRVVIGEGRKFPEDVRRFIFSGADKVRAVVASYLAAHEAGVEDADSAAAFLLDLIRSRHHIRALAEPDYALSETELAAHVAGAVRFFLNGIGR